MHIIAYSRKSNVVEADVSRAESSTMLAYERYPDKGFLSIIDPASPPLDAIAEAEAGKHLQEAIAQYGRAIELGYTLSYVYLGMGWCQQQSGQIEDAKRCYWNAVQAAFEDEKEGYDFQFYAVEAIGYLEKLLDKEKDSVDLKKLKEYRARIQKVPHSITPILIGLAADAPLVELTNPTAAVAFDLDGSGIDQRWGWIKPNAAWLVFDLTGEGKVQSGCQLFGSMSFITFWKNGFEPLATLDDNRDGVITGAEREGLALWRDANSNGVSDPGEVRTIAEWGIESLSCNYRTDETGMALSPGGVRMADGTSRTMYDWVIEPRQEETGK